VATLVVSQECL